MALTNFLKDIADAIRYAEQSTGEINAQKFAERIRALQGGQPTPPTPPTPTPVPQEGTWQLKTTSGKKYIVISTDDDNMGNASWFRMLRTYGFPYTMNVEAEHVNKNLGNDIRDDFTSTDAPSLFPNGVTVSELGKYLHDNNLGEVTQHGASSSNLWNSAKLWDSKYSSYWTTIYNNYVDKGGTKTEEELKQAIKIALADSDVAQGAPYVERSKETLESGMGFPIYALAAWGGQPIATIDDIEVNLNSIKGGSYPYREKNYKMAFTRVGEPYKFTNGLYEKTRGYYVADIQPTIDSLVVGDVIDLFAHFPFGDLPTEQLRQMLDTIKANVDNGTLEVVTPSQYHDMGEYVSNPITSISLSRSGSLNIGDTDTDSAYTATVTYADGTTNILSTEYILDRSKVDTSASGVYEVYAYYRGFKASTSVAVIDSSIVYPDGLKAYDNWFVIKKGSYMYCGNHSKPFTESAENSSLALIFRTTSAGGKINGWKSKDDGRTWTQVTTNRTMYGTTIPVTRKNDEDGGYNFSDTTWYKSKVTVIETSGNFEWNYPY